MARTLMTTLLLTTLLPPLVNADDAEDLKNASQMMCEKMKTCARQELDAMTDLTPDVRKMMVGMLDNVCEQVESFRKSVEQHELYAPAAACMNSMSGQSCADMKVGARTDECAEYEKLAQKYRTGS